MRARPITIAALMLASTAGTAHAAPLELLWQAHVLQLNGFPIDTVADVHFALRDGPEPEDALVWEDTFADHVILDGLVHVVLGSQTALQTQDLPLDGVWVHVSIAGTQPIAPHPLPTAAYAARAQFVDIRDGVCDSDHVGRMRIDDSRVVSLCTPDGQWTALSSTWEHEHEPFITPPPASSGGQGTLFGVRELSNGNIASVATPYLSGIDGYSTQGITDVYVRVTTPTGGFLWGDSLNDPGVDRARGMAVLDNDDIVAVGYTETGSGGGVLGRWTHDGTLVATDNAGDVGVERWSKACSDGAGGYYVAGYADGWYQQQYTEDDAVLIRYGADNTRLWTLRHRWNQRDYMDDVALLPDGNVVVIGSTRGAAMGAEYIGGEKDNFVELIDPDGNVLTHRQFGTTEDDSAYGIAVRDDGLIAIVGGTNGAFVGGVDPAPTQYNAIVAVLNADLTTRWAALVPTTNSSYLRAAAWDEQGRLHAVGGVVGSYAATSAGGTDQLHVVFDDTGVELFAAQNGTHRNDVLYDIDIARDGDLLMGGAQYFSGNQPQSDVQRRNNLP